MGFKIDKETYTQLVESDIELLDKHFPEEDNIEKEHIKLILRDSIKLYYPDNLLSL